MTCIIDASAAVELILGREHSMSIGNIIQDAEQIITPEIFVAEVANVFWKYHRFEGLPAEVCYGFTKTALQLPDDYIGHVQIMDRAVEIAIRYEVTVYDALYLGLSSIMDDAGIISIDKKLRQVAGQMKIPLNQL